MQGMDVYILYVYDIHSLAMKGGNTLFLCVGVCGYVCIFCWLNS